MKDLNATMFYKAKFSVKAIDPTEDLLWDLVYEIRCWLLGKWNKDSHKIIKSSSPSDYNGHYGQLKKGDIIEGEGRNILKFKNDKINR